MADVSAVGPESAPPMCGQLPSCTVVGVGAVVDGVVAGGCGDGVELPRVAAQVTPTPIVRDATTTSRTILNRAMATSFRYGHQSTPTL